MDTGSPGCYPPRRPWPRDACSAHPPSSNRTGPSRRASGPSRCPRPRSPCPPPPPGSALRRRRGSGWTRSHPRRTSVPAIPGSRGSRRRQAVAASSRRTCPSAPGAGRPRRADRAARCPLSTAPIKASSAVRPPRVTPVSGPARSGPPGIGIPSIPRAPMFMPAAPERSPGPAMAPANPDRPDTAGGEGPDRTGASPSSPSSFSSRSACPPGRSQAQQLHAPPADGQVRFARRRRVPPRRRASIACIA